MKLLDKLLNLTNNWVLPKPYVHKQETADELFQKVVDECEKRAQNGCRTLLFHWDYVYTNNHKLWLEQHKVCLEVVHMLRKEGLKAVCRNTYEEPFVNHYGDTERPDSHHYIDVSWGHPWDPYGEGEEPDEE